MGQRVNLVDWKYNGDKVRLVYADGTIFYVRKDDFNEHFGFVVNVDKDCVLRSLDVFEEGVEL